MHCNFIAAKFYTETFGWEFQKPAVGTIPAEKMMTFKAPGDIFTDEGVLSKVEEIPKSGAAKFFINVDSLETTMDVSVALAQSLLDKTDRESRPLSKVVARRSATSLSLVTLFLPFSSSMTRKATTMPSALVRESRGCLVGFGVGSRFRFLQLSPVIVYA